MGPQELVGTLVEVLQHRSSAATTCRGWWRSASARCRHARSTEIEDMGQRALPRPAIAGKVYPDARRLVAAHHRAGHTVALASSATRFQAAEAAADLDIEHVLVTEIEDEDGILTGKVRGPILWGPGKAQAVREFAAERGVDLDGVLRLRQRSRGRPYLETVGRPHPLNPDLGLTAEAQERGWPVHRLHPRQPADPDHRGPHGRVDGRAWAPGSRPGWGWGCSTGTGVRRSRSAAAIGSELAARRRRCVARGRGPGATSGRPRPRSSSSTTRASSTSPVLASLLRRDFTAVAKKELATDPIFAADGLARRRRLRRPHRQRAKAREALAPAVETPARRAPRW